MGLAPRQWVTLLVFYTTYLLFGAAVFYQIEHKLETVRREKLKQARIDVNGNICSKWYIYSSFVHFLLIIIIFTLFISNKSFSLTRFQFCVWCNFIGVPYVHSKRLKKTYQDSYNHRHPATYLKF